ncbi:MAG: hypothetical protein Q8N84_04510 [bacterium]|nr:hypothetical protein [bacterium]
MPNQNPQEPQQQITSEAVPDLTESKILLEWESPERPFKRRDTKYFLTILLIIGAVSLLLIYMQELLLIAVLLAALFVTYALATVEPNTVKHVISTRGVESAGRIYTWDQLKLFWFGKKLDQEVLNLDTKLRFPGRVIIVLTKDINRETLKNVFLNYILFLDKPRTNWFDEVLDKAAKILKLS